MAGWLNAVGSFLYIQKQQRSLTFPSSLLKVEGYLFINKLSILLQDDLTYQHYRKAESHQTYNLYQTLKKTLKEHYSYLKNLES